MRACVLPGRRRCSSRGLPRSRGPSTACRPCRSGRRSRCAFRRSGSRRPRAPLRVSARAACPFRRRCRRLPASSAPPPPSESPTVAVTRVPPRRQPLDRPLEFGDEHEPNLSLPGEPQLAVEPAVVQPGAGHTERRGDLVGPARRRSERPGAVTCGPGPAAEPRVFGCGALDADRDVSSPQSP
jgi:hypothetical protein